jgi:hypothetical protein
MQRVVGGDHEANRVDEELSRDVEEDQEEVESSEAEDDVDLGHIGLPFEIIEEFVVRQLDPDMLAQPGPRRALLCSIAASLVRAQ